MIKNLSTEVFNNVTALICTLYELPQRGPVVYVAQLKKRMSVNYPPSSRKEGWG